jgi:exodeoxyribonuclease VII large subunit
VAQLAARLQAQGLMDASRKLPLPSLPATIALVTSPSGKAVHDVLRTLKRRWPLARVLLFGTKVEGADAVDSIIAALTAAQDSDAELILLVRGGGSYEDLMPFNDERLALVIAHCRKPLISGIGHEPDNTIADMVASLRASTPTAAAESAVPVAAAVEQRLGQHAKALNRCLAGRLGVLRQRLNSIRQRPLFDNAEQLTLEHYMSLEQAQLRIQSAYAVYPARASADLRHLELRLSTAVSADLRSGKSRLDAAGRQLHTLGSGMLSPYAATVDR